MKLLFRRWLKRRRCWHHNHITGESWVKSQIIDYGRKMYWCKACQETKIV